MITTSKESVLVTRYHDAYAEDMVRLCGGMNRQTLNDLGMSITDDKIEQWTRLCRDIGFVLVINGRPEGLIGAIMTESVTSGAPVLQHLFWYVEPEHRKHSKKLLDMLEEQAKTLGAEYLVVSMMLGEDSDVLGRFYEIHGYKKFEVQYLKELNGEKRRVS